MAGIVRFASLEEAMRAGYEQFDPPHFPQQPYWLVRASTAKGWALAIAAEEPKKYGN
jgi:negative regulator of replication initiation